MLSNFEMLLTYLLLPEIFDFLDIGALLMPVHDGKNLHILHHSKIEQFPRNLHKYIVELILGYYFFFFFAF